MNFQFISTWDYNGIQLIIIYNNNYINQKQIIYIFIFCNITDFKCFKNKPTSADFYCFNDFVVFEALIKIIIHTTPTQNQETATIVYCFNYYVAFEGGWAYNVM